MLMNILSIIVTESLAILVGLLVVGENPVACILLVKSLIWRKLVLIKFKLKSAISILCFFSRDIEFKMLRSSSLKLPMLVFGGLYTKPIMKVLLFNFISMKMDS